MSLPLLFTERKSHDLSSSLTKILKIASPKKYSVSIAKECQKDINDILRQTTTLINVGNETNIKIEQPKRNNSLFKLTSNKSLVKMIQIPKKRIESFHSKKQDYLLEKIKTINIKKLSKRTSSDSTQSSLSKTERSKEQSLTDKKKRRSLSQTNITHRNKECNKLFNILNESLNKSIKLENVINQYSLNTERKKNFSNELSDINDITKTKINQKGLKYIRDNKNGNNILFREEMANLIDYGDCHYKLDASLCYKNKTNIYKQYKMIREEADVKEKIPVRFNYSNKIEENNNIISSLFYSNKVRYNHLLSKC